MSQILRALDEVIQGVSHGQGSHKTRNSPRYGPIHSHRQRTVTDGSQRAYVARKTQEPTSGVIPKPIRYIHDKQVTQTSIMYTNYSNDDGIESIDVDKCGHNETAVEHCEVSDKTPIGVEAKICEDCGEVVEVF